jgi:hypothetical protein
VSGIGSSPPRALFRANEIDVDILPELTEVDLEKLGVQIAVVEQPDR